MATKVFVNLPVADLTRSRAFFEALGYAFNEQFSNEKGACLVIDENFFAMLLTHELFTSFSPHKAIAPKSASEVMVAFDMPNADAVRDLAARAIALGATPVREPQELGFMVSCAFEDLDGHIWEPFWMDPGAVQQG